MKPLRLWFAALLFAGCLFDNKDQVAGAEDFPNTIVPLGKVAADAISAHTHWDQFQNIDTTPNLSADSVVVWTTAAKAAAKFSSGSVVAVQETTLTVQQTVKGISVTQHVQVHTGDGNLSTHADNRIREYDLLRSKPGDTLEWTQLLSGDAGGFLWGAGDSGTVVLKRQVKAPVARPQVARLWATLKARIRNRGKSSTVLSYSERCLLVNGDTTFFTVKGIHGDSSLVATDTSLVTFDQNSPARDSICHSKARYWVKLGKLTRPFADNALLHFEIVNKRQSGVIRYDSISFTPDTAVLSGHPTLRGTFTVAAQDEKGARNEVKGSFRHDSIQISMRETREGVSKSYHLVYNEHGEVRAQDTLSNHDFEAAEGESREFHGKDFPGFPALPHP